jgi:hypothetical protein
VGKDDEAISPLKQQRKVRKEPAREKLSKSGRELFPCGNKTQGKKHKQIKNFGSSVDKNNELGQEICSHDAMALIVANATDQHPPQPNVEVELEEHGEEKTKKIKKDIPTTSAVAGNQPHREP